MHRALGFLPSTTRTSQIPTDIALIAPAPLEGHPLPSKHKRAMWHGMLSILNQFGTLTLNRRHNSPQSQELGHNDSGVNPLQWVQQTFQGKGVVILLKQ